MRIWTKNHLSDGELRAYADRETSPTETQKIVRHLEACESCRSRYATVSARAGQAGARIQSLLDPTATALSPQAARARLQQRMDQKENNMISRIFARKYLTAWMAGGLIVILAVAMAVPQVRAAAVNFLGLFRVEQVRVIEVDPGNLPQQLSESNNLAALFSENVEVDEGGEPFSVATAEEASRAAGFTVRLPESAGEPADITVKPGGELAFNVDVDRIKAVLRELGREDIEIPPELDGETVTVRVPSMVAASFGECEFSSEAARERGYDPDDPDGFLDRFCTTLMQLPSPTIEANPGLDVNKIGEAYLQLAGMDPEQAAEFASSVDWASTLIIPLPDNETNYKSVSVDGVEGTLITPENSRLDRYVLIWVRDGIMYGLAGAGEPETAVELANSLK